MTNTAPPTAHQGRPLRARRGLVTTLGVAKTTLAVLHKAAGVAELVGTGLAARLAGGRPDADEKPVASASPLSPSAPASSPQEPVPVRRPPLTTLSRLSDRRLRSELIVETSRASPALGRLGRWSIVPIVGCSAVGLGVLALADEASRHGSSYNRTSVLFWLGLLLIFVPIALRAPARGVDRRERLALVVLLGVALYLVKLLASPDSFTFSDEYTHLRNTQDIFRTHHLFAFNPLLPTAAYYPGLAALTAGLVDLTGLSIFVSGVIVIGAARVLFCASFFLIAERFTRSGRAAAAASLVYAANPMFLFWGASFSYENLALPLAAFVVWWVGRTHARFAPAAMAAAVAGVVAVTVTHHVVGFALAAVLAAWWLAEQVGRRSTKTGHRQLGVVTLAGATTTLVWFFVVADPAPSYLLSHNIVPALRETGSLLLGHTSPRRLYTSGGETSPSWEFLAGFMAIGLLLLALPLALRRAWWSRRRAPVVVAMVVAIAFPLTLVPRLAPVGVAISGRSSEYVYAALGCVIGLLLAGSASEKVSSIHTPSRARRSRWVGALLETVVAAALLTFVFVGNITIGTAFYQRLPEATSPKGYPSTVQPDVIAASKWARTHLGIGQPFGASAIDSYALATYGGQDTLDQNRIWPVFFGESIDGWVAETIETEGVRYVLVDWRMTRGVPQTPGYYFSPFEPGAGEYRSAFSVAALEKFSSGPCTRSIYKADDVEIFDLSQIESGACRLLERAPGRTGGAQS